MINHIFQNLKDDYLYSRGAPSSYFAELIQIISTEIKDGYKILVLGCNSGANDLIPLIENIKKNGKKNIKIFGIDDSPAIKKISYNADNSDIQVILINKDIEIYDKEIFDEKFDIVISFFVLNHLTNWKYCLLQLTKILKDNGIVFIPRYQDNYINAIENNSFNDNEFELINFFHKKRFEEFASFYNNSLLGSNIKALLNFLSAGYKIEIIKEITYSNKISQLKRLTNLNIQHSPIFWGQEIIYNFHQNSYRVSQRYDKFIQSFREEKKKDKEKKDIDYTGTIYLYRFTKLYPQKLTYHDWDYEYRKMSDSIYRLPSRLINPHENRKLLSKYDKFILQLLLGQQAFIRKTNFFSSLFWDIKRKKNDLLINIKGVNTSFETLVSTRNFKTVFYTYLTHLLIFRLNDTNSKNEILYSLADVIYDYSKTNYDWVIGIGNNFSCQMIENYYQTFVVISLPQSYLVNNFKMSKLTNYYKSIEELSCFLYNNYNLLDFTAFFDKIDYQNVVNLEKEIFDFRAINEDYENRKTQIKKIIDSKYWAHLEQSEKDHIIDLIAKRIPRFILLAKLGVSLNFTNKVFENNNRSLSTGGFFFNEDIKLEKLLVELKNNSFTALRYKFIKDTLNLFSSKRMSPIIGYQLLIAEQIKESTSLKSAIAAIMSRNMSHNLGSHVIFYLKTILSDVDKMFDVSLYELERINEKYNLNVLEELKDKIQIVYKSNSNKITAPFLLGIGKFFGYLQERQDFIATIANDFIPYYGSVSFKDFIYDELNPDLRVERHKASEKYKIKNILLDYIVKSENYGRDSIKIYFKEFDGTKKNHKDLEDLRKIYVDMPGGIMGRQAFFSIFENIIRNSAKHSKQKSKLRIIIDITKSSIYKEFYRVRLFDKNNNADSETIEKLKIAIQESYILNNGKLSPSNKGIKEMRISAAWLRGLSVAEIDENTINPKILTVLKVDDNGIETDNQLGNVCYEFYLQMSKDWIIVSDSKRLNEKENSKIKSYNDFIENDPSYKFVFYDKEFSKEKKNNIIKVSPSRCMEISNNDIDGKFDYLQMYSKWIKNKFNFDITREDKYFCIIDEAVKNKYNDNDLPKAIKNKIEISTSDEEINNLKSNKLIVFRKHNDTENSFKSFKQMTIFYKTVFAEGISGHNSTDRLLRNEEINEEWLLRMTESALTKVLIIDERIFKRISTHNVEVNFTEEDLLENTITIEKFKEFLTRYKIDQKYSKEITNLEKTIIRNNKERVRERVKTLYNALIKNVNPEILEKNKLYKEIYNKKNIFIYNIEKYNDSLRIMDLDGEIIDTLVNNDELIWRRNNNINTFDFVVIHQGILDKLYEFAKSKQKYKKRMKEGENYFTALIKNKFVANIRYIIHSGRSKPEFLPKQVAFNQFSSIEVALFDSKFSLTEQLFAARLEVEENE